MARFWKEQFDEHRHVNHMPGVPLDDSSSAPRDVYFVEVQGFCFEFLGLGQLEAALGFVRDPRVGSTRVSPINGDHWEFQDWHGRLPKSVRAKSRRPAVARALQKALTAFRAE